MQDNELQDLGQAQQRKKLMLLGVVVAAVVIVGALVLMMSPGNKVSEYEIGGPCQTNCGRNELLGWICVPDGKGANFCTRRCGEGTPSCPDPLKCRQATENEITASGLDKEGGTNLCLASAM